MLYALTGDVDFINNIGMIQKYQKKGGRVTMCEVVDKFVQRGREQGIKEEGYEREHEAEIPAFT